MPPLTLLTPALLSLFFHILLLLQEQLYSEAHTGRDILGLMGRKLHYY